MSAPKLLLTDELELDLVALCSKHNLTPHELYLVSLGRVLKINAAEEAEAGFEDDDEPVEGTELERYLDMALDNFSEDPQGAAEGVYDDWVAAYEAVTGTTFND